MKKILAGLLMVVAGLSGAFAQSSGPAVLDMQDTSGIITTLGPNRLALTTPHTYTNEPVDVIYLNSSADTTIYPRIGFSGYSVLIYITRGALAGHSLTIDCSGEGQPISLNGVVLGSKVTLYPADHPKLYKLVSSEDGDHYDIFEIGRYGRSQSVVPGNGQTVIATDDTTLLTIKPAKALASLSVRFPPHPQDGDGFALVSTKAIASVKTTAGFNTIVGGLNAVKLAANGAVSYKYSVIDRTWYRMM